MERMLITLKSVVGSMVVFVALLITGLAVSFYLLLGPHTIDLLTKQMLQRQQVTVRSGAKSIEAFFNTFGKSLTTLASTDLDQEHLDNFMKTWQGTPVAGVIVTDKNGIIITNANRSQTRDLGGSIADRDYFTWAMSASSFRQYVVSKPVQARLGASKGQYIVVVATPIANGKFRGVLAASVILSELTQEYVGSLKLSEATRVYIVDRDGVIVSAPWDNLIGVNYFGYLEKANFLGAGEVVKLFKSKLAATTSGTLTIALPNEQTGILSPFLVAYAPVFTQSQNVGNKWLIAMATPTDEALNFITPLYIRGVLVLAIMFLVLLAYAIRLARYYSFKEAEEYEHRVHKLPEKIKK